MEYAPIKFFGIKAYQIVLVVLEIHDQKIGKKKELKNCFLCKFRFLAKIY
jgi:hypothetical protein